MKSLKSISIGTLQLSLGIGLFGLLAFTCLWRLVPETIQFLDDNAFSFGFAREILAGNIPLNGLPSHLGARHPGPFYPLFVTAHLFLAGGDFYLAAVLLTVTKVLSVGIVLAIVWLLIDKPGVRYVSICGVLLAAMSSDYVWLARVDWANNTLFFTGALTLLTALLVQRYGTSYVSLCLLASTILLQNHLSSAPLLVAVWGVLLIQMILHRVQGNWPKGRQCPHWLIGGALLGCLVLWVPVVIYEFQYQSNFSLLFSRHIEGHSRPGGRPLAGLREALALFVDHMRLFGINLAGIHRDAPTIQTLNWVALLGMIVYASRPLLLDEVKNRWFASSLLLGTLIMVVATSRLMRPIHLYYLSAIQCVPWLLAALAFGRAWQDLFLPPGSGGVRYPVMAQRICALLFVTVFLAAVASGWWKNIQSYTGTPFPHFATLRHAQEVAPVIQADIGSETTPEIFVMGRMAIRANGYLLFLDTRSFPRMMYAGRIREFPANRAETERKRSGFQYTIGYLISCPNAPMEKIRKFLSRKKMSGWQIERSVPIAHLPSAAGCALYRIKKDTHKS